MPDPYPEISYARNLVAQIVRDDNASALFGLLKLVCDPNGDPARYSIGWQLMRDLFVETPEGEAAFNQSLGADESHVLTFQSSASAPSCRTH